MTLHHRRNGFALAQLWAVLSAMLPLLLLGLSNESMAVPSFARQTGQNCVACHAGGNFPELTSYGRLFKLTGYTLGERTIPLAAMAVVTDSMVKNTSDPNGDYNADFPPKHSNLILNTGSIFLAGKVTDNIGAFMQFTMNRYVGPGGDGKFKSVFGSDNADIRYSDRFIDTNQDFIFGVSVNNNPSVQDVWNSAPAWGFDVVPQSNPMAGLQAPVLSGSLAQQVAGFGGYIYWNKMIYAEISAYRTAVNSLSFLSYNSGVNTTPNLLSGNAPYWRLAYTKDWGANSLMVGTMGMIANQHDDATNQSSSTSKYKDIGLDAQYQYNLDPHTLTATASYIREKITWGADAIAAVGAYDNAQGNTTPTFQSAPNASDTKNLFRAKATYVYRATYGGSLQYFNLNGSYNSALQMGIPGDPTAGGTLPSITNNTTGKVDTVGYVAEAFWLPVQYVRVGLQYTMFTKYLGASSNYDGWGRNASDNNTLFFYVWGAY